MTFTLGGSTGGVIRRGSRRMMRNRKTSQKALHQKFTSTCVESSDAIPRPSDLCFALGLLCCLPTSVWFSGTRYPYGEVAALRPIDTCSRRRRRHCDGCKRKAEEQTYPFVEPDERLSIGSLNFIVCTLDRCGVRHSPMCRRGMSWPDRTDLMRCLVAHSENEVHCRSIGSRKFVPRLASQPCCRYACGFQFPQRLRSHRSRRMTPCTVRSESASAPSVHNRFGHD